MHPNFKKFVEKLHPKFEKLILSQPCTVKTMPKDMPKRGIYLFSEGDSHLYVGRSNDIRQRVYRHCRPSLGHNKATFAFKVTREITGNLKATYKRDNGSRAHLMLDTVFLNSFKEQKERIRNMDLRFVEEADANGQALLEMYAAIVLNTPYNDFDNH